MAGQASSSPAVPGWLWALGVIAVAAIGGSMLFALAIGITNFGRIGV
jgi:hypothetical protein